MKIEPPKKDITKVKTKIPENDTLQILNKYATYYNMSEKDRQNEIKKRENKRKSTQGYEKITKDKPIEVNGVKYQAKEIINDPNGFQAIIFQNLSNNESVLSIAGSFSVKKPFSNLKEWYNDWMRNNARVGMNSLPPQFYTALETLDKYKEKYNIKDVVGYSLGAILAGMIASFERHSDVRAYMYNGGLPTKMFRKLLERYGDEIKLDSSNMITLLADKELLTNLISVVEGAGIYELAKNKDGTTSTHEIETHDDASRSSYLKLREQSGWEFADTLSAAFRAIKNAGAMVNVSFSPGFSSKKTRETTSESPTEQSAETKTIIKAINKNSQSKDMGQPTGFAAPISSQEEDLDWYQKLEEEELPPVSGKCLELIKELRRNARRMEKEREMANATPIINTAAPIVYRNRRPSIYEYYKKTPSEFREFVDDVLRDILEDFITRMGYERHDYT